ncbi:uncharacterized protein LOC103031382 isoform X2 [Paramuricea clavata]|uniref:Uncharacterized protein LOC103031382 isoform X2 n=1 Tax=Paramuricea clavata TaxID=317549 RepID=A0A7D9ERN4_PARCT|nr:uncharacterized protein LOC103031382 isoform X2 [Paramuricea clavata]
MNYFSYAFSQVVDFRTWTIIFYDPLLENDSNFHNKIRLLMAFFLSEARGFDFEGIKKFKNLTLHEPQQLDSSSCGVFDEIPILRKYMAMQLANTQKIIELPKSFAKKKCSKHDHDYYTLETSKVGHIQSLPDEILEMILKEVLKEGDKEYCTLSLVCKQFKDIVTRPYFQQDVHYTWLNSVHDWTNSMDKEFKQECFKMFDIKRCFTCNTMYKEMLGFIGKGKFGECHKYYADLDFPGYCCKACFPE